MSKKQIEYLQDENDNIWGYDIVNLTLAKDLSLWEDVVMSEPCRFTHYSSIGDLDDLPFDVNGTAYVANHREQLCYIITRG